MFCSSDLGSAVDVVRVFGFELELSSHEFELSSVVSTIISGILFARFHTVECISKGCSFLL